MGTLSLAGAGPAGAQEAAPRLAGVEVEGTTVLDPQRVAALSGLPGTSFLTPRAMQEAIRTLWNTGLFDDVRIDTRPVADGAVAVITVDEAPVITGIDLQGQDKVKEKDIREKIPFRVGDRMLQHRLHRAAADIERLYEERGYYLADVSVEPVRVDADSTAVVVRIDEGRKVAIEAIQFRGNRAFSGSRLRGALDTDRKGFWFWQQGEFDEAKWRTDLSQRLPAFYGEHGYVDMRVVADSMWVDRDRGAMQLFVTVDEGPLYRTGNIELEGNSRFSQADLRRFLRVQPGETFNTRAIEETQADLLNLYADDGYIYAQVQPIRRVRPDTTIIDLTWQIREGSPAEIRHVAIKGNTVTHESVIRRHLFVEPGQRFRRTDVRNSLLALEGLGFFEPGIVPATRVVDQQTGDIDLTFEVQERRTGSLTLGAAVGGGTGLSGFLGYEQPNLFGQAKSGRVRWEFGSRNNNLELGYTEPVFMGTKTSLSTSFFNINQRYIGTSFRQQALGGSLRLGTPLPWDEAARIFYGYTWQRIDLEATDGDDLRFRDQYPRTESSVTLSLVRDTRLPRLHPIQGARHSIGVDLAGGPLGGTVGFHKYELETSWFAPTLNDRTVLNLSLQAGGINSTGFVPLTEQYILGGVQFPSEGLRGYPENRVGVHTAGNIFRDGEGRTDDRGNAFLLLTAEHFFKITDTVYTSVFYDAGNVWNEFRDVTFADLKRGAGVGIQIDLPGFGPMGLDYAYGFDRLSANGDRDPGWQLHFRFGNLGR
ncbi:MAG TPA: outer membrane protein assembly factor BamA [Gemmatimonadota bacterium]|nr:outer membrane protein assembly factor BamA [Gemmatimonadota bacterium]